MKIGNINTMDRKFWQNTIEPGFSPERNKRIIEESIVKYEKNREKKLQEFRDKFGERAEAVASFWKSNKGAAYKSATDSNITKYFGKQYLAHLQGKRIVERLESKFNTIVGKSRIPNIINKNGTIKGNKISDVRQKTEKRKEGI
jgi:hypothetical protein